MSSSTLSIVLGIFLILHGLMHASLTNVPLPKPGGMRTPFFPAWWRDAVDPTWTIARLGLPAGLVRWFGSALWLIATAAFVLVGLGVLGVPGLSQIWQPAAVAGALVSLLMLLLYWHNWYVVGAALNILILVGVWGHIPAALFN